MPSPETRLKYAVQNTPRYTSYPTAPHFHAGISAAQFGQWLGLLDRHAAGSLYIHIPYCREMCWYCGCSTRATRRAEPVAAYLESLLREIDLVAATAAHRLRIQHVHFGGGTPTILSGRQMSELMARLRQHFDIATDAEIAIEIDPRVFDEALARQLAAIGINRASLGVQTFDPGVQANINRRQPYDTVAACVETLRTHGLNRISFDLLYGLPGQTREICTDTVQQALRLGPDRLSVFGYAHVPHIRRHQKLIDDGRLPDARARLGQAMVIADALIHAGYVAIGIDHYAKAEDSLARLASEGGMRRNFQGYTTDRSDFLIGLGASAISRLPQGYAQNSADVRAWTREIRAGNPAICRGIELSRDDRIRGAIIERLMCHLTVDTAAVSEHYGVHFDVPDLADLEAEGLVQKDATRITIPEDCRMLARIVAARFDAHLHNSTGARHSASV